MAGDGQRPGKWADGAGSVLVYAVDGDRLASQAILVDEDLVAQGRAEMADDRARFVDLEHIFFDQNIGRRYTREEYIEHLRRELPDQVLRAEADLGAIDQWENLALAAFHYRFDRPPRRTLSDG